MKSYSSSSLNLRALVGRQHAARFAIGAIALIAAQTANAADWFVDGVNGSNNNTGTSSAPLRDVWRAWSKAQPGDTILLMPTKTYGYIYLGNKSGLPGKPITLRSADAKNLTKVSGMGKNYAVMINNANYVNVQHLDLTAPGHGTYAGWSALYAKNSHHLEITNNYVHDAGCSGIQTESADYVNIMYNRVEDNAKDTWNNVYCSGISTHENLDSDTETGFKMWITNNIISGNTNTRSPQCKWPCTNSDGNGIIIDDTRRTQTDYNAYKGKTLIQNNVIFNNGGRGIAIFISDNVVVRNNTLWFNNQDPYEGSWRPGEIGITHSAGVNVSHNIFMTDGKYGSTYTGKRVAVQASENGGGSKRPIVIDYNVVYSANGDTALKYFARNNTVSTTFGTNNKWANPQFKNASRDPALAQFQVSFTSPALKFAAPVGLYSTYDLFRIPRGLYPTAGAYQLPK